MTLPHRIRSRRPQVRPTHTPGYPLPAHPALRGTILALILLGLHGCLPDTQRGGADSAFLEAGGAFSQPDLAAVLTRLRDQGPDDFYRGETAARDLGAMGWNSPESIHVMAESFRRAFADRNEYLADPDFVELPVDEFLSDAYADSRAATISLERATPSADVHPGIDAFLDESHTTHYSVVDDEGNAVAVTTSVNSWYGGKVVVEGAGFFLNNTMDDFAAKPGTPNQFGLVQRERNAVGPAPGRVHGRTPIVRGIYSTGRRVEGPSVSTRNTVSTPGTESPGMKRSASATMGPTRRGALSSITTTAPAAILPGTTAELPERPRENLRAISDPGSRTTGALITAPSTGHSRFTADSVSKVISRTGSSPTPSEPATASILPSSLTPRGISTVPDASATSSDTVAITASPGRCRSVEISSSTVTLIRVPAGIRLVSEASSASAAAPGPAAPTRPPAVARVPISTSPAGIPGSSSSVGGGVASGSAGSDSNSSASGVAASASCSSPLPQPARRSAHAMSPRAGTTRLRRRSVVFPVVCILAPSGRRSAHPARQPSASCR